MNFVPTGDGIAAALLALEALAGADLADRSAMEKLPQTLVNVPVADRDAAMRSAALAEASEREARALEGRGRVLVRPSGTEQLVRVMVEAPTRGEADEACERLVAAVQGKGSRPLVP
jgi:phosphoglucosamine mutase